MLALNPAPRSDPGPTLNHQIGQVSIVVVNYPKESVPKNIQFTRGSLFSEREFFSENHKILVFDC